MHNKIKGKSFISYMMKRLFFFISIIALLLSACSDNDSFSTDASYRLTFSADTVRLDTLFSTVPSSTYTFWVFNKNANGVRIRTARLERGNQSGFRVNVDGVYLNPVATDFELREGDSLRVFVEVTTHENLAADPQLVEDNLLFTLESGVEQRINLRTYSWDAQKIESLQVADDMTIVSDRPVVVYGTGIEVAKTATLTIKNTTLYFHGNAGIHVEGQLIAENSLFRGDRLDHMFSYLPYDRVSGQWKGISVAVKAPGCTLTDCEIHSAYTGLFCDSTTVTLTNTVIHNCRGFGLYAHDSEVSVTNCQMSNTLNDCLTLLGGTAKVDQTTLAQFYPFSAPRGAALRFAHTKQDVQLTCTNTLVTGYDADVVFGGVNEDGKPGYTFQNCILRTTEVTDETLFKDIIWEKSSDEIQGSKHFVLFDDDKLCYDFSIKEDSPAYEYSIGRKNNSADKEKNN